MNVIIDQRILRSERNEKGYTSKLLSVQSKMQLRVMSLLQAQQKKKIRVEVCSKCHPFYTGSQKLLVEAGGSRVEKFNKRVRQKLILKLTGVGEWSNPLFSYM